MQVISHIIEGNNLTPAMTNEYASCRCGGPTEIRGHNAQPDAACNVQSAVSMAGLPVSCRCHVMYVCTLSCRFKAESALTQTVGLENQVK